MLAYWVKAFLVALLPYRLKRAPAVRRYQRWEAHAFSGILEGLGGALLFLQGLLDPVCRIGGAVAMESLEQRGLTRGPELQGFGIAGLALYLLHPWAWLAIYLFLEGTLRALEAVSVHQGMGLSSLWLLCWIKELARREYGKGRQKVLGGPRRRDEVELEEEHGLLRIFSGRRKAWREDQVVSYRGEFFRLQQYRFARHGPYHAHHYLLRRFDPAQGGLVHSVPYPEVGEPPPLVLGREGRDGEARG